MDNSDLLVEVSQSLANSFDIILGERLTLGNICKFVFRARRGDDFLVVKIGSTKIEKREIELNRQGYEKMREIGAINLIPSPLEFISIGEASLIVMQDCGLDFWHAVQETNNPASLYRRLTEELTTVYRQTLHDSDKAVEVLNSLKQRLIKQYLNYLFPVFGEQKDLLRSLEMASMDSYRPGYVCFSSFDFTPEDVFLTPKGLKFASMIHYLTWLVFLLLIWPVFLESVRMHMNYPEQEQVTTFCIDLQLLLCQISSPLITQKPKNYLYLVKRFSVHCRRGSG